MPYVKRLSDVINTMIFDYAPNTLRVLAYEGYRPMAAENGVQTLALYRQQQPDFIILDIMMPELDGCKV